MNTLRMTLSFLVLSLMLVVLSCSNHPDESNASVTTASNGNPEFEKDMEYALNLFDTSSVIDVGIEALEKFEKISAKYSDEWLGPYWTAYTHTQVHRWYGMNKSRNMAVPDVNPATYIEKSQEYLDQASVRLPNKSDKEKSDFYALQSLIYSFKSRLYAKGAEDAKKYVMLSDAQENLATKTYPDNPLVLVLSGTYLIGDGRDDENNLDYRKILAAKVLLEQAKQKFEAMGLKKSMTTQWNQQWIGYWGGYCEKLLKGEGS